MSWISGFFGQAAGPARTGPLDSRQARRIAALHHEGGFARGWDPGECAALLADPAVVADGVFAGSAGEPLGFVLSRLAADEAEILSIVVSQAARRGGFGRALLAAHLAQLSARGTGRLFLEVEESNQAARALYRHFGFAEVGRREGYYPRPDGSRVAALVLRLDLG